MQRTRQPYVSVCAAHNAMFPAGESPVLGIVWETVGSYSTFKLVMTMVTFYRLKVSFHEFVDAWM